MKLCEGAKWKMKIQPHELPAAERSADAAAAEARACMFDTPMIHSKRPLQKFLRCAETGGEELGRSEIGKHGQRKRRGKRKERIEQTDGPLCNFFSAKVKVKFVG